GFLRYSSKARHASGSAWTFAAGAPGTDPVERGVRGYQAAASGDAGANEVRTDDAGHANAAAHFVAVSQERYSLCSHHRGTDSAAPNRFRRSSAGVVPGIPGSTSR